MDKTYDWLIEGRSNLSLIIAEMQCGLYPTERLIKLPMLERNIVTL